MIDIKKYATRAFKTIYNRCGFGVADRNVICNSNVENTVSVHFHRPLISSTSGSQHLDRVVQSDHSQAKKLLRSRYRFKVLLFFSLLLGVFTQAQAGEFCVANPQFNGVIDGTVTYTDPPFETITQITIDGECTFKNFTAANPLNVTINYQTNDDSIYLITFDNVVFTGNMACAAIDHKLWVVNSPEGAFSGQCQDIIIPAETIAKDIPASTAGIGDPFTYTLTLPSMEYTGGPSTNDLGNIVLTDNLNALGVDVTLMGTPVATWQSGGAVAHTFTNTAGLLTFGLPNIPTGDQIIIEITVVLDNTAANLPGTSFTNTAEWTFSRAIDLDENGIIEDGTVDLDGDGIIEDEFFDPLPGESGISLPMTIAAPDLIVTKTSTESALNLGIPAIFSIDVQNNGGTDAWHATILDQLPDFVTAGTCDTDPSASVSARIFAADGTTPVSGLLAPGTDYSVSYTGAPTCQLSLTMLSSDAVIGPTERLIINYQTQLDADTTNDGFILTNIAAATEWFSGDGTYSRITHTKTLTDGTPAVIDHEDSYNITTALSGYFFQKTVQNLTTGVNPATTAAPNDTMRYRLRVFNVDQNIDNITITDTLDPTKFDTSTFSMIAFPAGSTFTFDTVTGELQVVGFPTLSVSQGSEIIIDFEIDIAAGLTNGEVVPNQATLSADGPFVITSDDPYLNGIAAPGDPTDSTNVVIQAPGSLSKINPVQTSTTIGEQFTYTITVPAVAVNVPLYDVRILDVLSASAADMNFVSASVVSGGTWTLSNTGTATSLVIEDAATGIDIPANGQAVIEITVELSNTITNQSGLLFNNSASFTYNRSNGDTTTQTTTVAASTSNMTVLEPNITTITKIANNTTPISGETIRYSVTLTASGGADFSDVFDVTLTDNLDLGLVYVGNPTVTVGTGVSADNTIGAPDITGDGSATPQTLVWSLAGTNPTDIDIAEGESIIISYDVRVDNSVLANQALDNSAVAQWTSIDGSNVGERNGDDGIGGLNNYTTAAVIETVTIPNVTGTISKTRSSDTYGAGDDNVRIGDIVEYELRITASEGTLGNLQLVDTLPQGLKYEGIVSINNNVGPAPYTAVAPFSHADVLATDVVEVGDATAGSTTVTWSLGDVTNQPNDGASDDFVIIYRARVLNGVFTLTDTSIPLNNSVTMSYDTASGNVTNSDLVTQITALQPLLTVTKSAAPAGADTVIDANEVITYRVEVTNNGDAPAYDAVVQDILPVGIRQGGVVTNSITLVNAGTVLPLIAPSYNSSTGLIIWNLDSGTANTHTLPAGETLRIIYTVQVDAVLAQGLTLTNTASSTVYYSFDDEAVPTLASVTGVRETYGPSNTASTTLYTGALPTKALLSSAEVTIGDEVIYQITVPGTVSSSTLYDVQVTDVLNANLTFTSATVTGGIGVTDSSIATQMNISIDEIPAGQQAVIELRVRVQNIATAQEGVSINNTASYTYAYVDSGTTQPALSSTDIVTINIIEPLINIAKTVVNQTNPGNPAIAGDVLRYTLSLTASGAGAGDNFADAFDISIEDNLSLGLAYQGPTSVNGTGNTITDPAVTGDGSSVAQTLSWNLNNATADIDVAEGTTVDVIYDVLVLDSVLANQVLSNSAVAQWTGLDGVIANERTGSGTPAENDYVTAPVVTNQTTPDSTSFTKIRLTDTFNAADANVRIGDIVEYELRIGVQEGLTNNLVLTDTLPQGLAFEAVSHINGDSSTPYSAVAPFIHSDITAVTAGDPVTGSSSVTFTIGNITNTADNNAANDDFVIAYRARVLENVQSQVDNIALSNNAILNYSTAAGATSINSSANLALLQPTLVITKSALTAGGDTVLVNDELVTYTVDVTNNGTAPAYDLVVEDVIPVGMRNGTATITMVSTTLVNAGTSLTNIAPAYNSTTGLAVWNFDSGVADAYTIPVNETLRIVYQVQTDSDVGAGLTLSNQAVATLYYSFDDDAVPAISTTTGIRATYGPSNTAVTTLTTLAAGALLKENPLDTTVAVGETFTYSITIPATPISTYLHDVRILDDLTTSAADLTFVSASKASGSQIWTPENTGTATNLVIEDITNGIDIPPNEQVVINVTVLVSGTATNVSGLTFTNTASYTYNQVSGDNSTQQLGGADTTANMTIVGPDNLTLTKAGPATIRYGVVETFTLNIQNTGTAPAWDITVSDILPTFDPAAGGMCDTAPANITAQMYLANGTTTVGGPLVQGTDYVTSYSGCTLTLTMQSTAAALVETNRLIITYDAQIDLDTPPNSSLTNIAGVTEWFSGDTAGAGATGQIKTFSQTVTNGTVGTLDHEDAFTTTSETPTLTIEKRVVNRTTNQDPGTNASPGDTLGYEIYITNTSNFAVNGFTFTDDLDALNTTAMFAAGSLNILPLPVGADGSNSDINGGSKGSGFVDIRNLSMGAAGSGTETVVIKFDANLVLSIADGTTVYNQGLMDTNSLGFPTDDPNIAGTTDPTETLISSAPQFEVLKISTDLTGDANILLPGDTLRYTITVKNIGNENTINSLLRDQLPANTTYIANSTRLNGVVVNEPTPGVLPLQTGILINAPENTTAGYMRADATATTANVATITFDVTINSNVVNGTIISNQAYVSASGVGSGAMADTPSDDPGTTTIPDDPTRDVIGDQPLVDAHKTVSIQTDNNGNGELDPGDILRYTITISNLGAANATSVSFIDAVPANTTYVADSVTLNTLAVGQPDGGVSPLIAGIPVSSSDLTPPLPTAGNGTLSAGQSAVITFDVAVNVGVASGTIISNQGNVYSNELPVEPTDADGIDSNGDQPTLIIVGNISLLSTTKTVSVVGGGAALAGGQLEYRILVTNISSVAATNVTITDNLDLPEAGQLTYVTGSGLLNGLATGVSYAAPIITADYATPYGNLLPGQTAELVFRATINNLLPIGTTITNTGVVYWNAGTQTANASISIDVGGTPGVANVNGSVWHDANFNNILDNGELVLAGWFVDIYRNNILLGTVISDANGVYSINGLLPNYIGTDKYELKFRAPGSTSTTALLGYADSDPGLSFINGLQRIYDIVLYPGTNVLNLNLPIDPNGVVYNSVERVAITGATISLLNAGTGVELSSSCFDDVNQQNQVTTPNGYYKFNLNFSQADCAPGGNYLIRITAPSTGYSTLPSAILPQTDALDVPNCPGSSFDAISAIANICEAQTSEFNPSFATPVGTGTYYYLHLTLDNGTQPDDSQLFNNHLPIDPVLNDAVFISKISPLVNVTRSQFVPYTITVKNKLTFPLTKTDVIDTYPAGFKYVKGSARLNGVAREPVQSGLLLTWSNVDLIPDETLTFKFLLIVGAAVNEGDYINRAHVIDTLTNSAASGVATATVRVVPDPVFDCTDVIGKVFDDKNLNGYQDEGEKGIAGARVVTVKGLEITTDKYGRFHLTCAVVPDETRGSNFIIKLDDRSLPSGYRVTTENPRVQRATRGKMLKFNFGAAIHRVVSMDLADAVFVSNSTEMHKQWIARIDLLIKQLKDKPSILHLSYLADVDDAGIVDDRLEKVKQDIIDKWLIENKYKLTIETEIFWRRGGPPGQGDLD